MPSHRSLRMAEAIREVVSSAILFEVADPRVRDVTVLRVEVAGDLRSATAYVSIMGSESDQARAMKGLRHASGFLQSRIAARLQTRFTPTLSFKLDDSVKKSIEMSKLIDETLAADRRAAERAEMGPDADADADADPGIDPEADLDDDDSPDDDGNDPDGPALEDRPPSGA